MMAVYIVGYLLIALLVFVVSTCCSLSKPDGWDVVIAILWPFSLAAVIVMASIALLMTAVDSIAGDSGSSVDIEGDGNVVIVNGKSYDVNENVDAAEEETK